MDVIPGRENQFELTPNKLGTFSGKCAELCGTYHSDMLFTVHVVTPQEYKAHIDALKASGQNGKLQTGRIDTNGVAGGRTTTITGAS
jgi:cytochrome c oxidase subunit 2